MATFHISAITKEGDTYAEVVESVDRFTVYREIRQRGDTLVSIKEEGRGIGTFFEMLNNVFAGISDDEKVVLTRNLAAMLEAGLTTSRALGVMEKQTKNKKLKSVLSSLANEVKRGGTFSAGLAKFKTIFPALLISMVKAGEESGKLAQALRVVSV
jgi:type IV pilus assembly protein PilC